MKQRRMRDIILHSTTLLLTVILLLVWVMPGRVRANSPPTPEPESTAGPDQDSAFLFQTPEAPAAEMPAVELPGIASALPVISVWYEGTYQFGQKGNPQEQVNILGNVSDPDGSVSSLTYSLNDGSAVLIPIGPDGYRLERKGDFNVAIDLGRLREGSNKVTLTARDNSNDIASKTITFNYMHNQTWSIPYSTNWAGAGNIHTQAQVVDGLWQISGGTVRPVQVGYDRLIAIGDMSWGSYEVTVPITIHAFYPVGSDQGGVGLILRWQGHTGTAPLPREWYRIGAYGYYSNRSKSLAMWFNGTDRTEQTFNLTVGQTYIFKMRVEAVNNNTAGRYSLKVWESGTPEPAWNSPLFANIYNRVNSNNDLLQGSMLLVAHRADASFGNVTITRVGAPTIPLNNRAFLPIITR